MSNYQEQIAEFENSFCTVVDKSVRELSEKFEELCSHGTIEDILAAIEKAKILANNNEYNVPTKMQIYYDIANAYHDIRMVTGEIEESHLEKEIYYFRYVLNIYESKFYADTENTENIEEQVAENIAIRAYVNLGNAFQVVGRYIVAMDNYYNALNLNSEYAMASLNLSCVLFDYAELQIKDYEKRYYYHAGYHYYQQAKHDKVNLESQEHLKKLEDYIKIFSPEYIENFLSKDLRLPLLQVCNNEEIEYRKKLLFYRLFLDPCLDILSEPCFAIDSINLPFKEPYSNEEKEFIGLFNQIKQEYHWARYLWYEVSDIFDGELPQNYLDRQLNLIDTGDFSNYSLQESMLRTAFRVAYSLFDRIGFFINQYFDIELKGTRVSFKNIWKDKLNNKEKVPNPIMSTHSDNLFVHAMYWLQKDFWESEETNITAPNAIKISKMRNDMEHNCLRTGRKTGEALFTIYTTENEIENNAFQLLKLARELIIYLCLAVKNDMQENINHPKK